jgi:putative hemolysin
MGRRVVVGAAGAVIAALSLGGCGDSSGAAATTSPPTASSATSAATSTAPSGSAGGDAAAYCTSTGGVVDERQPTFNTNGPQTAWVSLCDPVQVCHYEAADKSRIYLDLVTLSSKQPTLAALAYLAKVPLPASSNGANPAAIDCAALGGTSEFGTASAAGGGLVDAADPEFTVVNPCTFADGSFIDEWGIAYYADGAVRGKDLTTVFRFDQSKIPAVFSSK